MSAGVTTTKKKSGISGFSVLELMVSLSVILIIVAVVMQSFASYSRTQQFVRFVDEVGYMLTTARQQTLASKDDTVYGLYVGTSTVELFSGTSPVVGAAGNEVLPFAMGDFSATSSFSSDDWYVYFARITGEPSATGTIVITSAALGRTATITVHQSGLVE